MEDSEICSRSLFSLKAFPKYFKNIFYKEKVIKIINNESIKFEINEKFMNTKIKICNFMELKGFFFFY